MAKRRTGSQDERYPEWWRRKQLRGYIFERTWRGMKVIHTWPKPKGPARTSAEAEAESLFKKLAFAQMNAWPVDRRAAEAIAIGSQYTWRDVLGRAMVGRLIQYELINPGVLDDVSIQTQLDSISNIPGTMLMRAPDQWVALVNVDEKAVLGWDIITHMPVWIDNPITAITELTGPVTAGPGTGAQATTITPTGVTPGSYTGADITVGADGRLTAATNGSPAAGITQLTGPVTAGPGTGTQATTITPTGVTPGSYTAAAIHIDADGRITTAANGATATAITQLTGDVNAGPGPGAVAATLSPTGVSAGSYSASDITIGADGRVTAAASGATANAITQLTGAVTAGPGPGSRAATITPTGVVSGVYNYATINVGSDGRIISASTGIIPTPPAATEIVPGWVTGRYYTAGAVGAGVLWSANTLYATLFKIPLVFEADECVITVSGAAVSSEVTVGLYANNNGVPGTLLHTLGVATTTTTGNKIISFSHITDAGPWIWFATSIGVRITTTQNVAQTFETGENFGQASAGSTTSPLTGWSTANAYVSNSLPNPFPASPSQNQAAPAIWFRKL